MDLSQVTLVLHEYEKLKGMVPALKAEYESVLKMIEKAKELYKVEQKAYEDMKAHRVTLAEELGIQKQIFIKEKASALEEIAKMKENAEIILREAKLMKVDIDAQNAALAKSKEEHKSALKKLEEKIALIVEVVKKLA